jgi:predicted transcriptional regulator
LGGEKTVELRRAKLAEDVSHVVVYSTSPVRQVVGWFEVAGVDRDQPNLLWRRHGGETGVSRREFDAYFEGVDKGTAISVGRVVKLEKPMGLAHLGSDSAPQSFRYLDKSNAATILKAGRGVAR